MRANDAISRALSLDAHISETQGLWQPEPAKAAPEPVFAVPNEAQILEVLQRPVHAAHTAAHELKERELRALFAMLAPAESLTLQRRLTRDGDPLAIAFQRLIPARRQRLLDALARLRLAAQRQR